jgi:hypothetical protein
LANHNLRIGAFAEALAGPGGDRELIWIAAWLHDIGLLIPERADRCYLRRSWRFAEPHARAWGLSADRRGRLRWMLRYTHALRPIEGLDPLADVLRRAVQVEHTHGLMAHGLERAVIRGVFARHPRAGLTRILADFTRITVLEDGPGQLADIFWPGREFD